MNDIWRGLKTVKLTKLAKTALKRPRNATKTQVAQTEESRQLILIELLFHI